MKKSILSISILALLACGGGDDKNKKSTQANTKEETVAKAVEKETEKKVVEITVKATGNSMAEIAFDPKSLTIPANSRVKLTLENISEADGMLHNFVLVELGSGQEIATAGMKAGKDQQFVPKDDRVIAYTEVSSMGEALTIEFDAPEKGSYHYICTYPGHYPNMIGRLDVI